MRQIIKVKLPILIQDQLNEMIANGKSYEDIKKKFHKHLLSNISKSQKHICCYCECRIYNTDEPNKPKRKNVHIEHFYEQSDYKLLHHVHSLDYHNNMICSCEGDKDKVQDSETNKERSFRVTNISCGHKKGKSSHNNESVNYNLLLNPHDNISHLFSYYEGYISVNTDIMLTRHEIEQVEYTIKRIGLDSEKLNRRRKQAIEYLQEEILRFNNKEEIINYLRSILDEPTSELYPYFSTLKDNFSYLII